MLVNGISLHTSTTNYHNLNYYNKQQPLIISGTSDYIVPLCHSIPYKNAQVKHTEDHYIADFEKRDQWVQKCLTKLNNMRHDSWGPEAPVCPAVIVPDKVDPVKWKRNRIIAVAKRYIGLPYTHHHIPDWVGPEGKGMDCSNLTAWVYNFGLGIKFTSKCECQAEGPRAPGRKLKKDEPLEPGDLLFIMNQRREFISHVVIYIEPDRILDTRLKGGCQIRPFKGWYKTHFIFARRIIE